MDIVTRIKLFLNIKEIAVSQFADACEIPRPTVSQLLNGRNKKVSDEIITKIHVAYPSLSVMWLMFGEEPMLIGDKSSLNIDVDAKKMFEKDGLFAENLINPTNGKGEDKKLNLSSPNDLENIIFDDINSSFTDNTPPAQHHNSTLTKTIEKISKESDGTKITQKSNLTGKEIVNIMVFYSDNSFESFKPSR